jgi:hypothetical protein
MLMCVDFTACDCVERVVEPRIVRVMPDFSIAVLCPVHRVPDLFLTA